MNSVLITGVSSGIGLSLAQHYLDNDHRVFGISRRASPLAGTSSALSEIRLDLTDADGMPQALKKLLGESRQLDLVVLNAGSLGEIRDMQQTPLADLRRLMDVNVWANKSLLDSLLGSGIELRQVIAISSGAAVNGNRGWNGYSISKAALNMLVQLYAKECPDIHFAAIAPGLVDTAMQEYLCGLEPDSRFPSLESLRTRRNTDEMLIPDSIAIRLAKVFERASELVQSGGFLDIRNVADSV